jgi:hypothetical protein
VQHALVGSLSLLLLQLLPGLVLLLLPLQFLAQTDLGFSSARLFLLSVLEVLHKLVLSQQQPFIFASFVARGQCLRRCVQLRGG